MSQFLGYELGFGLLLCLIQFLAALPWITVLATGSLRALAGGPFLRGLLLKALPAVVVIGLLCGWALQQYETDSAFLLTMGRFYAALLTLQLLFDLIVLVFVLMLLVWPRGGTVALAAFAEGVRQPMFWLLTVIGLVVMLILPILPYFTFGEDLKMVKELGYDTIMFLAGLFAVLAAATSISEEIEGRTAVTLMSKPVSRRQFLLGKFFGTLMAALFMTGLLTMIFFLIVWFKPIYDREDFLPPDWVKNPKFFSDMYGPAINAVWGGILWWFANTIVITSGVLLGFCQVMVLLAIAVALATRLPMVVNVPICTGIFFLGHLSPILKQVSQARGSALLRFVAQLFESVLPGLELFNIGSALTRDPLPETGPFAVYMASVTGYALIYTTIALLFGLILFEDRDLA